MNVSAIVTAFLEKKSDASTLGRNDEEKLHVSDIANGCTRAVWHRVQGGEPKVWDGPTLKKFEYGHRYEALVREALLAAGYDEISVPDHGFTFDGNLVGHPDICLFLNEADSHLIEVKTTMLFRQGVNPPAHPDIDTLRLKSPQYVLQGAAYAYALGAERFTIHVSDRGTGLDADYEFETAAEWPAFAARWETFKTALASPTEPEVDLPAWTRSAKGASYLCRQCPVVTCRNNPAYTAA